MYKCLRITFSGDITISYLRDVIQKHARKLNIEGIAQLTGGQNEVRLIACGQKEQVEDFLDVIHKEEVKLDLQDLQIEPFIKERDYRGVFRVIE